MYLTLKVNTKRGQRRLNLLVEAISDLDPLLSEFGRYLRAEAKKRFDAQGPGWPQLASTTKTRFAKKLLGRITKGGGRVKRTDRLRRIEKSLPEPVRMALFSASKRTGGSDLAKRVREAALKKPVERELLNVVKELDRFSSGKKRRKGRNALKRHKLLGRLPASIAAKISRHTLQVYSRVPWSGVHNKGGTAGHNSKIPARTFLELRGEDMDVLEQMLRSRALLAFGG